MSFFQNTVIPFFKTVQITDIIDILIVAVAIYYIIKYFRKTRAAQLLKGIAVIFLITYLAEWFHLNVISYILQNAMQVGFIALIVIFQPELRRALEHVGSNRFTLFSGMKNDFKDIAAEVCEAARHLSQTHTGALIVFETDTMLDDLLTGGTPIDAVVSSQLLENIFVPNTPLHDGAVIIRGDKILRASCVLPLSSNKNLSNELGTRHRAGLGISELSDCICLIVSEETGKISVTKQGNMIRGLTEASLYKLLSKALAPEEEIAKSRLGTEIYKLLRRDKARETETSSGEE